MARTLACLSIALLAGCAGAKPAPQQISESSMPLPSQAFDEGSGAVQGIVADTELAPVPGARIRLDAADEGNFSAEAASGEDGRFAVTGLRAGTYRLLVAALGYYDSVPKRVEVGGEAVEVQVVLEPLPGAGAHHVSESFARSISFFACVMHPPVANVNPLVDDILNKPFCTEGNNAQNGTIVTRVDERRSGELTALLVEVAWTPASGACKATFRSDVLSPQESPNVGASGLYHGRRDASNPWYWSNLPNSTAPPTRMLAPRLGEAHDAMHSPSRTRANGGAPIVVHGDWRTIVEAYPLGTLGAPVDVSCLAQQTLTTWISQFFVEPIPSPDWTATA